ncbi:MAG: DUF4837 domain-containing protein, partial [Mediterranea massiliensis]|nr:DUF4837 domain-containing protein [Mediterranea massiliensis]
MKKSLACLFFLLLMFFLSSCRGDGKGVFTPTSSGRPFELLVVINQDMWERP